MGGTGLYNGDYYGEDATVEAQISFGGPNTQTAVTEGNDVTLDLATDCYLPPSETAWTVDWGDGIVESFTTSFPTLAHAYTSGDGTYNVSIQATLADGTPIYDSGFVPVTVAPAAPTVPENTIDPVVHEDDSRSVSSVTLKWNETSDLIDGFDIYYRWDGYDTTTTQSASRGTQASMAAAANTLDTAATLETDGFTLYASDIAYTGSGDYSYTLSSLPHAGDYTFLVAAKNAAGISTLPLTATLSKLDPEGAIDPTNASYVLAHIGFELNFYGYRADRITINEQGCVTFWGCSSTVSPGNPLSTSQNPIIAPFEANADIGPLYEGDTSGGTVTYEAFTGQEISAPTDPVDSLKHQAFAVHWTAVDYSHRSGNPHALKTDTFSLYLYNRSDRAPGDFDIAFVYGNLAWDTADCDGGINGTAGSSTSYPARAGYSNANPDNPISYELPGSGTAGGLLALANTTVSLAIVNPSAHLVVRDLGRPDSHYTDTKTGLIGVVEDRDGHATLALSLQRNAADPGTGYYYTIFEPGGGTTVGAMPSSGEVDYIATTGGSYLIKVTNPLNPFYERILQFYVARLGIVWTESPSDKPNITYENGVPVHQYDGVDRRTVNLYTGQRMELAVDTDLPDVQYQHWGFGNLMNPSPDPYLIKDYLVETKGSHIRNAVDSDYAKVDPLTPSNLTANSVYAYCTVDAPNQKVFLSLTAKIGTTMVTFVNFTTVNIQKPGKGIWRGAPDIGIAVPGMPGAPIPDMFTVQGWFDEEPHVEFDGVHWKLTGSAVWATNRPSIGYEGSTSFVQVARVLEVGGGGGKSTNGQRVLDGAYPYDTPPKFRPGEIDSRDDVSIGAYFYNNYLEMDIYAQDWLMWTPPGSDSIPVPIQNWTWSFESTAKDLSSVWRVTSATTLGTGTRNVGTAAVPRIIKIIEGTDTNKYPTWTDILLE